MEVEYREGEGDQSNWPHAACALRVPRDRKPLNFVAVDVDGNTVGKASDMAGARIMKNDIKRARPWATVLLRPVYLTEQDFRREDETRREVLWSTQIYLQEKKHVAK